MSVNPTFLITVCALVHNICLAESTGGPTAKDGGFEQELAIPMWASLVTYFEQDRHGISLGYCIDSNVDGASLDEKRRRKVKVFWRVKGPVPDSPPRLLKPMVIPNIDAVTYQATMQGSPPGNPLSLRRIERLPNDRLFTIPFPTGRQSELEVVPAIIDGRTIKDVYIAKGRVWGGCTIYPHDEFLQGINDPESIPTVKSIPFPAMKQNIRMGCVLNAFKMTMAHADIGMSIEEMMKKLSLTETTINSKEGIPWVWYHAQGGDIYTKLGIVDYSIIRAVYAPPTASIPMVQVMPPERKDFYFSGGVSAQPSRCRLGKGNWIMNAYLKRFLAAGIPVIVDTTQGNYTSHVVTAWGYDAEKRSYIINNGFNETMTMMEMSDLDDRWANRGYDMIVLWRKGR